MHSAAMIMEQCNADLRLTEFEVPEPGPGALVAEVDLGGVCGTDVHLQQGHLAVPVPLVLGHEAVGRVASLGPGVERDALGQPLRPGDPIAWASNIACGRCAYCVSLHAPTLCTDREVYGITRPADVWPHLSGAWAGHVYLHPGTTVVRLADDLDPLDVIALGCAGPTAVHGLLRLAPPRFGDTVVVQGSGPVGLAAAMYARMAGAGAVILVGGPATRLDLARELGVASAYLDIFRMTNPDERIEAVCALTPGNRGADLVVEATGVPDAVPEGLALCRPAGTYLVLGQYTDAGPTSFHPHVITRKQLDIKGSWAFSGSDFVDYVASLPRLLEQFDVRRLVTTYPLADANRALADVRAGRVLKAALSPGTAGGTGGGSAAPAPREPMGPAPAGA